MELAHDGHGHPSLRDRYSSHGSGWSGCGGVSRLSEFRVLVTRLPSPLKVMILGYDQKGWPAIEIELFKVMIASKDSKLDEVTTMGVFSSC